MILFRSYNTMPHESRLIDASTHYCRVNAEYYQVLSIECYQEGQRLRGCDEESVKKMTWSHEDGVILPFKLFWNKTFQKHVYTYVENGT